MTARPSPSALSRIAPIVNRAFDVCVVPVLRQPWARRLTGVEPVRVRYRGRRSGRTVELPVMARPLPDGAVVTVGMADSKVWWRNFRRTHPLELQVRGQWRAGAGVVEEPHPGAVRVRITWT